MTFSASDVMGITHSSASIFVVFPVFPIQQNRIDDTVEHWPSSPNHNLFSGEIFRNLIEHTIAGSNLHTSLPVSCFQIR